MDHGPCHIFLREAQKNGVPFGADARTKLLLKRTIYPVYLRIPDISTASLGARIRYLRKRLGYTITSLATMTELGHNRLRTGNKIAFSSLTLEVVVQALTRRPAAA